MNLLTNESRIKKEGEIYEDISHFIQIFKKAIALTQHAAVNIQKGNDYLPLIERIKTLSDQIEAISLKYKSDNASLPIQQMTFHRFICRIAQIIALPKAKYQNNNQSHSINCFITCLREVQRVVKKYQEEKLFCRIVELTQIIFIKFCINCEAKIKMESSPQVLTLQTSESMKKMNERMSNFRQKEKNSKEKSCLELNYRTNSQKDIQKNGEKKYKLVTISQTLSDIQKRYDSFKGMDVDYSFFKTSYFEGKNNYDSFYKDYLERNILNSKITALYIDDYQLFKKKSQKTYERNRRLKTNQYSSKFQQQSQQNLLKNQQNDKEIRLKKSKANKTCDQSLIKQKLGIYSRQEDMAKNDNPQSKVSYQMKNVYITLSKKNMNRQHHINRMSPSAMKRRILQTQSNNQSYININEKVEKSTTIHLQKKQDHLDVQYEKSKNNQIISAKESNNIQMFAKPLFKSKYLEINCVTKKKEANSKSQLILNRAPHKYIVKIEQRQKLVMSKPL